MERAASCYYDRTNLLKITPLMLVQKIYIWKMLENKFDIFRHMKTSRKSIRNSYSAERFEQSNVESLRLAIGQTLVGISSLDPEKH